MLILFFAISFAERPDPTHGYPACPPWYFEEGLPCTKDLKPVPWYQQKRWVNLMKHDPEFYQKALKYLKLTRSTEKAAAANTKCYSSCPPFWEGPCDLKCNPLPWYKQEKWIQKMKEDPEFAEKAKGYIPQPRKAQANDRECFAGCPPFWDGPCDRACHDKPWYQQKKWIQLMKQDPEFAEKAKAYIPMPLSETNERVCFEGCPPQKLWNGPCDKACHSKPWYQQKKWINLMKQDPEFAEKAKDFIPALYAQKEANGECFTGCPPFWEGPCDLACHDKPWYQQQKWLDLMEKDAEFAEKAKAYIPMPLTETNERVCYEGCPPFWDGPCDKACHSKPWYQQKKWVNLMKHDPEFAEKAKAYIPMPISNTRRAQIKTTERKCYAGCPPFWDGPCDRACHDKPWYLQEKWIQKMQSDPEFYKLARKYIPTSELAK